VAFLDVDRLYFELERFKAERGWYNLNLTRAGIAGCSPTKLVSAADPGRGAGLRFVREGALWEEIALALLKKYTERYYTFRKREWELPHLEYQDLDPRRSRTCWASAKTRRRLLPHPDRPVAGGDRRQAGRIEGPDRERRD
jgi:hypothetical protein